MLLACQGDILLEEIDREILLHITQSQEYFYWFMGQYIRSFKCHASIESAIVYMELFVGLKYDWVGGGDINNVQTDLKSVLAVIETSFYTSVV